MMKLLKKIYPLALAPVSAGLDQAVEILRQELPFTVHEYPSDQEFNGWVVPKKWEVRKAEIRKNGRLIYDGKAHVLGVRGYSQPFRGKIPLEVLKEHISASTALPDAIIYHCDYYYKVGVKDWGFCIPYNLLRSLGEGDYDVDLQTIFEPGTMKVCNYFLPGALQETIVLNAHSCHAAQANDDVAGMVVGVEVMKELAKKRNRYSYRLIIAAEHLGTIFYLASLSKDQMRQFKYGIFLEMLGNNNRLALQETFTGETEIDRASHHCLRHAFSDYSSGKFRKVVGNDETVWEAPGYEIPTISLSRFPYPEYHTSMDNETIILEEKLEESVNAVMGILQILESNHTLRRKFDGLIALSNPKYDLYIRNTDYSVGPAVDETQKKWSYLMDCLPRYFNESMSILDIATKHDVPYTELYRYLLKFKEKDLVEFL